jgi:hypothetical protein
MFNNICFSIDLYIYYYKYFILNPLFNNYKDGIITRNDYYRNYNDFYFNLIITHNYLILQ